MQALRRKVCVFGMPGVGKTSLVRNFVYGTFEEQPVSTNKIQVSRKTIAIWHQAIIIEMTMRIWDNNHYRQLKLGYPNVLRNMDGAILVCDSENPQSFYYALTLLKAIYKYCPNAKVSVVINKIDLLTDLPNTLSKQIALRTQLQSIFGQYQLPTFLTSAKFGTNVEALFRHMGQSLVNSISEMA